MKFRKGKKVKTLNPATWLLIKQFSIGLGLFCVVGLFLLLVWYGTRLQTFTITTVTVVGGETIDQEAVRLAAEKVIEGTYLRLIPRRFALLFPQAEITSVVGQTERIKDVEVSLLSNTELQITFGEYTPDTLWCSKTEESLCYFLDKKGYAFSKAPELSGGSLLRYYSLSAEPERGVSPFNAEDYSTTKEFAQLLAGVGWYVETIEIDTVRDVFYTLSSSSEVKTTLLDGAQKPFAFLQNLRQSKEFAHLAPGNFQYIDLRFGSKVFVNEELVPLPGSLVSTSTEAIATGTRSNAVEVE